MIFSWIVAVVYTLIYSALIIHVQHIAKQRILEKHKTSARKSLISNEQVLSPNRAQIDETKESENVIASNMNKDKANTKHKKQSSSQTINLTTLHEIYHTSTPFGAPVSTYEVFVAIMHSLDSGLHFGLLLDMFENSSQWNLSEQYLVISLAILLLYRIISFAIVFRNIPRYSYTKRVVTSAATIAKSKHYNINGVYLNKNIDEAHKPIPLPTPVEDKEKVEKVEIEMAEAGKAKINNTKQHEVENSEDPELNTNFKHERECPTFCSYSYLQLFFDVGYILELAPWLWNWEHTKIILPEFAWFCKMRSLFQTLPFSILLCTFLLSIDNNDLLTTDLHLYAIVSLTVSIFTIIFSLLLYDNYTLTKDFVVDKKSAEVTKNFASNFFYRFSSVISRIIILSFFIALFPWPWLFAIIIIPVLTYSGPYQLGNTDNEPLNLLFQALLVFPDYSAPFGNIIRVRDESYFNKLHPLHSFVVIIFGFPLLIILITVEKCVDRILKISNPQTYLMDPEKYATFRITTYTLSRFVESILELLVISVELFDAKEVDQYFVDYNSDLVMAFFYIAVVTTIFLPITFIKIHNQFVVDNEEDFDLSYAETNAPINSQGHAEFVVTSAQYNQHHGYNTNTQHKVSTSFSVDHHGTISVQPTNTCGSRHYLRQRQYWVAIHRNNYKQLAWILRSRQHVNLLEVNEQDQIGLTIVSIRHDWKCVRLLIKHGGGVKQLVHYAALKGELEILKHLHYKLNISLVNMKDKFDEPLIFSAIDGDQPTVVQFLADIGCNLQVYTVQGESAVITAAKKGILSIIKILGDADVNLCDVDDQGNNIAHYAAEIFHGKQILKYLQAKFIVRPKGARSVSSAYTNDSAKNDASNTNTTTNEKEDKRNSGLLVTPGDLERGQSSSSNLRISDYDTAAIQPMVESVFDFNHQNRRGMTPSYVASYLGQVGNLRVLVECGADLTITNQDGNNCLIAAAINDQPMVMRYLLEERKMDVNFHNDCQETALFWAASNGSDGCLALLIENQANLEKSDKYAITALMVAAEHGEDKSVEVLLKAGANANHQNHDGETALMKACAEGYISCAKHLVKFKTDHSISDDEGNTAIFWCCMTGNMDIFEYLVLDALKLTAVDVENSFNNDKETCIDWILENDLEKGIEVLRKIGVDVEAYGDAIEAANQEQGDDENVQDDNDNDEYHNMHRMDGDEDDEDIDMMAQ